MMTICNFDFHVEWEKRPAFSKHSYGWWDEEKWCKGSMMVDNDLRLRVKVNRGSYPYVRDLAFILLGHEDGFEAVKKALDFKRKFPYKVEYREGKLTGARDYRLVSAVPCGDVHVREVKARLHVSMYDKLNDCDIEKGIFLPDLIAFMRVHDEFLKEGLEELEKNLDKKEEILARVKVFVKNEAKMSTLEYWRPSFIDELLIGGENGWMLDN